MRRRPFARTRVTNSALVMAGLVIVAGMAPIGCGQFRPMHQPKPARPPAANAAEQTEGKAAARTDESIEPAPNPPKEPNAESAEPETSDSKVRKADHVSSLQRRRDGSPVAKPDQPSEAQAGEQPLRAEPGTLPPIEDESPSQPGTDGGTATTLLTSLPFPTSPEATPPGVIVSFEPTDIKDPAANLAKARAIVDRSLRFCDSTPKYTCRITRHERVGAKLLPQEVLAMNFRLEPRSVYYKWLDKANEGRELVYVDGENDGKIITLGGKSDFLMTGKRVKVDPSGFLAKRNGRYSIKDSGMDAMMKRLTRQLANQARGDYSHGRIEYLGTVRRKENHHPMDYLVHHTPPGADHAFPDGGTRHWFFDQPTGRMVLLHSDDLKQTFLEYYLFDRFLRNDALDGDSFNPDILWPRHLKTADTKDSDLPK